MLAGRKMGAQKKKRSASRSSWLSARHGARRRLDRLKLFGVRSFRVPTAEIIPHPSSDFPGDIPLPKDDGPAPEKKPRFLFETVSDLRSMPPAEYLIGGWIPERSVGLVYGKWGSLKTFIVSV